MAIVYLSLGSNLGDKQRNLQQALHLIHLEVGNVMLVSSFYRSEPWGFASENEFLNAAAAIETDLTPLDLLDKLKAIERKIGRTTKTTNGYEDRPIDLDVLLYDNRIIDLPQLTIPHAHLHQRDFVLVPLSEIAGEIIHPTLGIPIRALASMVGNGTTVAKT